MKACNLASALRNRNCKCNFMLNIRRQSIILGRDVIMEVLVFNFKQPLIRLVKF